MAAASPEPGPVQHAQKAELSARLRQALTQLPPREAEVFCLRFLDDLTYRQIGEQLNLETNAVGVLLHRARAKLREHLCPNTPSEKRVEVSP